MTSSDNQKGTLPAREFNHDLLVGDKNRANAERRWGRIAHVLVNEELGEVFSPYEKGAKALKLKVQHVGSASVLLMVASLVGSAALPSISAHREAFGMAAEICAILGLICAALASRFGPWRRSWLRHRYMTEVLRQWHFRRLLDGPALDKACTPGENYASDRAAALASLLAKVRNEVGQRMDLLIDDGADVLGKIPIPRLPDDREIREQLLSAYRELRLEHQLHFGVWKLSDDDETFLGLPANALIKVTDTLAGTTLLLALVLSVLHLFLPLDWAPVAAVMLAILGVAARAWRDGLALGEDRERYQEMRHRLELADARWEGAATDEERFRAAEEVEQVTLEELRGFLRSHGRAQFLF